MDKRILFLIGLAVLGSGGFFTYRKLYFKPEGIHYSIKPREAIKTGDSIAYSDQTPGASRWKWDFGDGEFSADQSGNHTYLTPGKFEVTLTAYGPFGMQKKTEIVDVVARDMASLPAGPSIAGPADVKVGVPATWQSSAKAGGYEWKVEGDATGNSNTQKGNTATYAFKTAGQRTLILTMHNPDAVVRQNIMVMADDAPQPKPAAVTAPIKMPPPQHQAQNHPHPANHNTQQGNKLDDLGGPVEIKK
jgi:hypothetical protein